MLVRRSMERANRTYAEVLLGVEEKAEMEGEKSAEKKTGQRSLEGDWYCGGC